MKVLIVEDEIYTAKGLVKMLHSIDDSIVVENVVGSVDDAVEFLEGKPSIDLIFMDIQLSDGISFEIFSRMDVDYPVIFTTSFNDYAIKAFEVNSVDYLLKPIEHDALKKSLEKFTKFYARDQQKLQIEQMLRQIAAGKKEYKTRLLVKTSQGLASFDISEIAYFYIDSHLVFIKLFDGGHYMTDRTLDELEKTLDPKSFFRLNRQFLASAKSISAISSYFNNTLKVVLKPSISKDIIVSRYSIKEFKEWLDA